MRSVIRAAGVGVVLMLAAGCYHDDAPRGGGSPHGDGAASSWCERARQAGVANMGADDADPQQTQQVLRNLDDLAAAAPAEIHADFAVFDQFEHAVLEPGAGGGPADPGQYHAALTHVADYLKNTCHITAAG